MPRDNIAVKSLTKAEPSSPSQRGGRPQHLTPAQHHGAELAAGWGRARAGGRGGAGGGEFSFEYDLGMHTQQLLCASHANIHASKSCSGVEHSTSLLHTGN